MSTPFNVSKFVRENKELVRKFLKKNTYDIEVPDFDVKASDYYQRSQKILKAKVDRPEYTQLQKLEYIKCAKKVEYFVRKYVKIISVDDGIIPFDMYEYQKQLLKKCANNRFVITLQCRQSGKTSVNAAYILWYNNFHSSKKTAILANKAAQARSILARVKLSYEFLPNFLKQGVTVYNKGTVEFGNNSNMFAAASSSDSIRGESVSLLYIDEAAFLRNDMEFYESTYPTISSGKETRVLISSTPKGSRGLFYKLWQESVNKMNDYVNHMVTWDLVPGRDMAWRAEQIRNTSREQFDQEHNVVFKGSINSLISGHILDSLPVAEPIETRGDLKVYKSVEEEHSYITVVDVSKGLGKDYHAFTVWDITKMPYEVVATYKNNKISTMLYPSVIHNTCLYYNNAMTLIELNNSGEEVANILFHDLEYENMLTTVKDRGRQVLSFGGTDRYGVTTSKPIKSIGCNTIKKLIEDGQVILNDEDLIEELGTFVPKAGSYEADKGAHDDLVMTSVLFAWASTQDAFKDFSNLDTRKLIIDNNQNDNVLPFGFIENDVPEIEEEKVDLQYQSGKFHGFEVGEVDRDDPFFNGF